MTTANAEKSGTFNNGLRPSCPSSRVRRHARHRQGHMGLAEDRAGAGAEHAAPRARARHQPNRQRQTVTPEVSERLIREALYPDRRPRHRHKKAVCCALYPDGCLPGASPSICASRRLSMRRLGVERIDLWQLHRIDPAYRAMSSSLPSPACRRRSVRMSD